MKHLLKFNTHADFLAAELPAPWVALDDEHVHYMGNIPTVKLPLGADGIENGYGWVDLGLPSGKKWAMCNVGATTPCDAGLLFQFGRVDGYTYGDANHQFRTIGQNTEDTGSRYIPKTTSGKTYNKGDVLDAEDDAAAVNMGGKWHMPTQADIQELLDNTTNSWVTCSVEHEGEHTTMLGRLFVSKTDATKKLFIPAAGYFTTNGFSEDNSSGFIWSSSVYSNNVIYAYNLNFYYGDCYRDYYGGNRYYGFSVRGVIDA